MLKMGRAISSGPPHGFAPTRMSLLWIIASCQIGIESGVYEEDPPSWLRFRQRSRNKTVYITHLEQSWEPLSHLEAVLSRMRWKDKVHGCALESIRPKSPSLWANHHFPSPQPSATYLAPSCRPARRSLFFGGFLSREL